MTILDMANMESRANGIINLFGNKGVGIPSWDPKNDKTKINPKEAEMLLEKKFLLKDLQVLKIVV